MLFIDFDNTITSKEVTYDNFIQHWKTKLNTPPRECWKNFSENFVIVTNSTLMEKFLIKSYLKKYKLYHLCSNIICTNSIIDYKNLTYEEVINKKVSSIIKYLNDKKWTSLENIPEIQYIDYDIIQMIEVNKRIKKFILETLFDKIEVDLVETKTF